LTPAAGLKCSGRKLRNRDRHWRLKRPARRKRIRASPKPAARLSSSSAYWMYDSFIAFCTISSLAFVLITDRMSKDKDADRAELEMLRKKVEEQRQALEVEEARKEKEIPGLTTPRWILQTER
jgi:hypothetical protein